MLARVLHQRHRWSRDFRSLRDRVLRRNRLSFPVESAQAVARLSQQAEPVTMVTSFPRSGNTWMRMMLTDIFAALVSTESEAKQVKNSWIESHNLIPDIYFDSIENRDPVMQSGGEIATRFGVFVKTHEALDQIERIDSCNLDNLRHLFLFRRPEDSLVSFYHFHCRPSGNQKLTIGGVDSFCLEHLGRWKAMTHSYLDLAMRSATRVHFVSYEDMLSEPEQNLAQCFAWLGESIDSEIIAEAVDRNRFERAQKNESSRETDPNHNFFRRGTSGAGRDELSEKTLTRIHAETSELMAQAKSRISSNSRIESAMRSSAA